jgi:hypothetical protein
MPITANTIKEGHRYRLGEYVIWFERKPGQGRRVTLFVKAAGPAVAEHVDQPSDSVENDRKAD